MFPCPGQRQGTWIGVGPNCLFMIIRDGHAPSCRVPVAHLWSREIFPAMSVWNTRGDILLCRVDVRNVPETVIVDLSPMSGSLKTDMRPPKSLGPNGSVASAGPLVPSPRIFVLIHQLLVNDCPCVLQNRPELNLTV